FLLFYEFILQTALRPVPAAKPPQDLRVPSLFPDNFSHRPAYPQYIIASPKPRSEIPHRLPERHTPSPPPGTPPGGGISPFPLSPGKIRPLSRFSPAQISFLPDAAPAPPPGFLFYSGRSPSMAADNGRKLLHHAVPAPAPEIHF